MHSCWTDEANKIVPDETSVSINDLPDPFNGKVYQTSFLAEIMNMELVITWTEKRKKIQKQLNMEDA